MIHPSPSNLDLPLAAGLFSVFLCVIFGANAVAIKVAFTGLGVFTTAAIRFGLAAAAIYLWARWTRRSILLKKGQALQLLIFSTLFTVQLSCFYLGLSKSNASRGTLLVNLLPFFILFLAHFFIPGDRISKRKLLGILLGFSGLACMFLDKNALHSGFLIGDSIILLATLVWSCATVYLKRVIGGFDPFQVVMYSALFALPVLALEAWFFDPAPVSRLDVPVVGAVLYQSLVSASFGFVAWNTMLKKYGAVALHSFVFIMPIAGVLMGGLILGEPITPKILLALAFIVSGIITVHWNPRTEAPAYPIRRSL